MARRDDDTLDGVLAGLSAQLERSAHFIDTLDLGAAIQAQGRVVRLLSPQLDELRRASGLLPEPRPFAYWRKRFTRPQFIDRQVPSQRVFTFWNRPIDTAPPLVQACIAQMRRVYPQVQVLDGDSARQLITIPERVATLLEKDRPAHFSDYVRTRVLAEHGGIWLDSTVWVASSLDEDLRHLLRTGTVFPRWTPDQIGNWFIASHANTPLINLQWRGLDAWWQAYDDLPDYFLYHRVFESMLRLVPEAKAQWRGTPPLSSTQAHLLQLEMMQPWRPEGIRRLLAGAPLQKLSYKYDTVPPGSVLERLLDVGTLD